MIYIVIVSVFLTGYFVGTRKTSGTVRREVRNAIETDLGLFEPTKKLDEINKKIADLEVYLNIKPFMRSGYESRKK